MTDFKNFALWLKEQIYEGGELDGERAAMHYLKLCNEIITRTDDKNPYLLFPVRTLITFLIELQRFDEAFEWAVIYKKLTSKHLPYDVLPDCACDLLIARILKNTERSQEGREISKTTCEKMQNLIDDNIRFSKQK